MFFHNLETAHNVHVAPCCAIDVRWACGHDGIITAQEVWEISSDALRYMHQASDDANQGFSLGSKLFSSDLL